MSRDGLSGDETARLRAERERLERVGRQLAAERAEVEHELRRLRDAVERAGGSARGVESRARLLRESRELIVRDQESTRERLAAIDEALARLGGKR